MNCKTRFFITALFSLIGPIQIALADAWSTNIDQEYAFVSDSKGNAFLYVCKGAEEYGCVFGFHIKQQCKKEKTHLLFFKKEESVRFDVKVRSDKRKLNQSITKQAAFCGGNSIRYPNLSFSDSLWTLSGPALGVVFKNPTNYEKMRDLVRNDSVLELRIFPPYENEPVDVLIFDLSGSSRAIASIDDKRLNMAYGVVGGKWKWNTIYGREPKKELYYVSSVLSEIRSPIEYFYGYRCKLDCSGHKAGWSWA